MLLSRLTGSLAIVLLASSLFAADHTVEVVKEGPPADELSKEIAAQLDAKGFKVMRGEKRTVIEFWPCKQWSVKADFKASPQVVYPFEVGQLVGVLRFKRKSGDFRDQTLSKGVYTVRYAQQPVDGNHVGTSPTRDFLVLGKAEDDKTAGKVSVEKLMELGAQAAEATHPAMLCLQRAAEKTVKLPMLQHNEEHDWQILHFHSKAKAGEKVSDLPVAVVVVGVAAE